MNKEPIDFLSYLKVIGISVLLAGIFLAAVIYKAQDDVMKHSSIQASEKALQEYIRNIVIVQNEDLEAEYPDNYQIDMHLGYLYKTIKEYDKAEQYYIKAVEKAPLNIYKPSFELASFYIEIGSINKAKDVIEGLPLEANDMLMIYLAELYEKLGDYYYQNELYYYASESYESAVYYANKPHKVKKNYVQKVNNKLYDSLINMADICVNNNKIDEAIELLSKALKVKPNDFAVQYKYALVTVNKDPVTSYKYFSKLFKKYPTKVDYVAYYQLLENLSVKYLEEGDMTNAKLFAFRSKNLLNFVAENMIYPRDIDFKVTGATLYKSNKKSKIIIKYTLQNISNLTIKRLYMDVVFKLGDKEIETVTVVLADNEHNLPVGESIVETPVIQKVARKYKSFDIPKLSAEIYLYKSPERKSLFYSHPLFADKVKIERPDYEIDNDAYIKYFVYQIRHFNSSVKMFVKNI